MGLSPAPPPTPVPLALASTGHGAPRAPPSAPPVAILPPPLRSQHRYYPRLPHLHPGQVSVCSVSRKSQPKLPLQPDTHPPRAPRPSTQHSWHRSTPLLRCPLSLKASSDVTFPKSFSGLSNPHPEPSTCRTHALTELHLLTEPPPHNEAEEDWSEQGAFHTLHQDPWSFHDHEVSEKNTAHTLAPHCFSRPSKRVLEGSCL